MCPVFFVWGVSVISDRTRINEMIRVKEVRVIDNDGTQLGVIPTKKALEIAAEKKLDLVEVAPNAKPAVCKIMDYGKYKYEQSRKAKEAKKNQKQVIVKEVKFKARIDKHDLETKLGKIEKFLEKDNKVKVSLMMFGRERMHADLGIKLLDQIAEKFTETATVEKRYAESQKFLMLTPKK